jgi:putative nucleotidyltransferase with HDIG domain
MSVKNQWKLLVGGLSARRPSASPAHSTALEFLERSRLVAALIFIVTVAAIVLISSAGMTSLRLPVLPGQTATVRVTAAAPFTYVSEEKTAAAREQFLNRVPPVYRLEFDALREFETSSRDLLSRLAIFEVSHPPGAPILTTKFRAEIQQIATAFNARGAYRASPEDITALLSAGDTKARATIFDTGLSVLRELYAEGIHDAALGNSSSGGVTVFQIAMPGGAPAPRPVHSLEDALTILRVSLATEGVSRASTQAIFRFFRNGVSANVVFDRVATQQRETDAARTLQPVTVNVARGQTIIEAGERVSPEQYEMFAAHRRYLMEHGDAELNEGLALFGRVLLVLAMVLASIIYIRLEDPETLRSNVRLGLLALVVILNLGLVRLVYALGGADFFVRDGSWASTLPYVAPTAFAPLIVAILIDAGSAIFMALLISIFTGVIYGNRLDLLVLTFLASLVAIYFCRDARRRGRVVRAATGGGLTVAAFAALIAFADQTPLDTLARQMSAGVITGLFTGVAVVGLLPVLESLFKRTTDITLLELTDYNHPLLRRMQLEAPGTYHHSLVVAQLAENASNAIGANPLLARVSALFHDIGKTAHPSYFTENQRDGHNPHDDHTPADSAQIIKRHVSDGVELAVRHHLPRAVIDVISQHHGTTLIRYFYQKAVSLAKAPFPTSEISAQSKIGNPKAEIQEAAFRYDGPRPQFKESAVISLADGVEAASRSLRSADPAQLTALIDKIVLDRIAEKQLDEAPLTFEDIARIKNSFQFTLLNMLHARVAYPSIEPATPVAAKA